MSLDDAKFLTIAYEEAKAGYEEGGIPVCISILSNATSVTVHLSVDGSEKGD